MEYRYPLTRGGGAVKGGGQTFCPDNGRRRDGHGRGSRIHDVAEKGWERVGDGEELEGSVGGWIGASKRRFFPRAGRVGVCILN